MFERFKPEKFLKYQVFLTGFPRVKISDLIKYLLKVI